MQCHNDKRNAVFELIIKSVGFSCSTTMPGSQFRITVAAVCYRFLVSEDQPYASLWLSYCQCFRCVDRFVRKSATIDIFLAWIGPIRNPNLSQIRHKFDIDRHWFTLLVLIFPNTKGLITSKTILLIKNKTSAN